MSRHSSSDRVATGITVAVVGAGVCGLSVAVRLAESGYDVRLFAREFPPATTSCAAGALFGPLLLDHPDLPKWSEESWAAFGQLAGVPGTGVTKVTGVEASRSSQRPWYDWLHTVDDLASLPTAELPDGFVTGWRYSTFAIDTPAYCSYLLRRLLDRGGVVERAEIADLSALGRPGDYVVNCTAGDPGGPLADSSVEQMAGTVLVVDNPGIDSFFADADDSTELTYFIPHGDKVILGGTLEYRGRRGSAAEVRSGILERCAAVEPRLLGARVLEMRVGGRPVRSSVRLEAEERAGRRIVHNYGHGGGGVSVAWGCAGHVLSIIEEGHARSSAE